MHDESSCIKSLLEASSHERPQTATYRCSLCCSCGVWVAKHPIRAREDSFIHELVPQHLGGASLCCIYELTCQHTHKYIAQCPFNNPCLRLGQFARITRSKTHFEHIRDIKFNLLPNLSHSPEVVYVSQDCCCTHVRNAMTG